LPQRLAEWRATPHAKQAAGGIHGYSRKTKILLAGETQRIKKLQAAFMQLTQ
jgi:hypothetical protein